jgi:hypothetical protein
MRSAVASERKNAARISPTSSGYLPFEVRDKNLGESLYLMNFDDENR